MHCPLEIILAIIPIVRFLNTVILIRTAKTTRVDRFSIFFSLPLFFSFLLLFVDIYLAYRSDRSSVALPRPSGNVYTYEVYLYGYALIKEAVFFFYLTSRVSIIPLILCYRV